MATERYTKPWRRERAARKRRRRIWLANVDGMRVYAPHSYWIRYRADELASGLQPFKLGRKHLARKFGSDLRVSDSRNA